MILRRCLLFLFALSIGASGFAQDFSVRLWVRLEAPTASYTVLAANKEWRDDDLVDFTSNSNLGVSSTSGAEAGWAIALQPNGSWTWNLSDGGGRLDYLPTVERQPIADGEWHMLAFSLDREAQEARLYRDGVEVAIYSTTGIEWWERDPLQAVAAPQVEGLVAEPSTLGRDQVIEHWTERGGAAPASTHAPEPLSELRVLAWNIWHGGRRDGREEGLAKTLDVIRRSRADVVAMQETYGSGPILADALGWHFYLRSSNLSVLSRYPIVSTHDLYQPFRLGVTTLEPHPGQLVRVGSLWIHYLPDYGQDMKSGSPVLEELMEAEEETRGTEIRDILTALEPLRAETDRIPLIVAGDYNSPSHLDWTEANRAHNGGLVVDWLVSRRMADAGFVDAFRHVHPDPRLRPGCTWSPRFTDSWQDRIDYVYYRGADLEAVTAAMLDQHEDGWPSDHAAVVTTLRWTPDGAR